MKEDDRKGAQLSFGFDDEEEEVRLPEALPEALEDERRTAEVKSFQLAKRKRERSGLIRQLDRSGIFR